MSMARTTGLVGIVLVSLAILAAPVFSAGSSSSSRRPQTDYTRAVKAVKAGHYRTAIPLLEREVARDRNSADAYNYLGFSHRKLGNLQAAMDNYRMALQIDPKHKGAHEYIGELYLMRNDIAKAKEHLAKLDDICWLGCEEYDDLKAAVRQYEAKQQG